MPCVPTVYIILCNTVIYCVHVWSCLYFLYLLISSYLVCVSIVLRSRPAECTEEGAARALDSEVLDSNELQSWPLRKQYFKFTNLPYLPQLISIYFIIFSLNHIQSSLKQGVHFPWSYELSWPVDFGQNSQYPASQSDGKWRQFWSSINMWPLQKAPLHGRRKKTCWSIWTTTTSAVAQLWKLLESHTICGWKHGQYGHILQNTRTLQSVYIA